MSQLPISNIVNISVSEANLGANAYNTSNIGLFSDEIPADSFGDLTYSFYAGPLQVGIDFGTNSKTYKMALAIFSQQPNILAGGGQLIIILLGVGIQNLALSGVAASGAFVLEYKGNMSTSIPFGASASTIQSTLQLVPGLAGVQVSGSIASQTLSIEMGGVYGVAPSVFSVPTNTLETSGSTAITFTITTPTAGQTIGAAITAASALVQFFGILIDETITDIGQSDVLAAAAIVQALNKIAFWVSYQVADIQSGGTIVLLQTGSFTHNRGLYYGDNSVVGGYAGMNALSMVSAYAGLGLSVNFNGSNTTITMNLKTLNTIQPDPSMTQTIYNEAATAGADIYPSIQGDSAVISNGANDYYDDVYNLLWFTGALQIAGYNYLATTSTKIPQTESGMDGLKGAYRNVCQQGVTNQFISPGSWTSPNTFGVQALLFANIEQQGYYIYSQPVAQQQQAARVARQAPLVQLAIKFSGAIQSSDVLIFVNQ